MSSVLGDGWVRRATQEGEYRMKLTNLMTALQWVRDLVGGEFVEARAYTKNYLGAWDQGRISEDELNRVVRAVNEVCCQFELPIRVCWLAGELMPLRIPSRACPACKEYTGAGVSLVGHSIGGLHVVCQKCKFCWDCDEGAV